MIVVVCGVTASGKSQIARKVADILGANILNGDAFQVYKHLNIGVNKPSSETIRKYSYQLIDFLDPASSFSIADYQEMGREIVEDCVKQGKHLVIEGGSGLYIKALLFDYQFEKKSTFISDDYENRTNEELYALLALKDSESTKSIHINNRKRIIRALRICDETGTTKSEIIASQNHKLLYNSVHFVALDVDRKTLYKRINERAEVMWDSGLRNEVIEIVQKYGGNLQSLQAIGYKEVIEGIENHSTDQEIIEKIQKNTRNYAKRQVTYFKHQLPVKFFKSEISLLEYIREQR